MKNAFSTAAMRKRTTVTLFKAFFSLGVIIGGINLSTINASAAESLFFYGAKGDLKKEANMAAASVSPLERGDELVVVKKEGLWILVKKGEKEGWVPKLLVNATKPVGAASLVTDIKSDFKANRERSTPRSVVASTRGLDSSRSMSRVREGGMLYRVDLHSVEEIEGVKLDKNSLDSFGSALRSTKDQSGRK